MNDFSIAYKEKLGLTNATFTRIDHQDTLIAIVYKVSLPGKKPLILKTCASEGDFHRELFFLKHLAEDLPVPKIYDAIEPKKELPGAILMECMEGKLLQDEDWTKSLAYEVGANLAMLHQHRTNGFGDLTKPDHLSRSALPYFEEKFKEELSECIPHLPDQLIEQCTRYFNSHRQKLEAVDGPCMVHRDFRPGNMIIHKGKLSGIIDWAGGRSGFAEQDFCPMVHRNWPKMPEHKTALLKGYTSIRPVPDFSEIIPLLQLGRALAVVGFTVRSGTWEGKNRTLYQLNRQFLENFPFEV